MNTDTAMFILDIVTKLLNKPLSSNEYYGIGGSKDIFRRTVERNKGIGDTCIEVLSNLIIKETEYNEIKKNLVLDYLKQFLTHKEKIYVKRNSKDMKTIVNFAAAKFSTHSNVPDLSSVQYFNLSTDGNYRVVGVKDLVNIGWTFKAVVDETIKMDFETIDNITLEHNGDNEQWFQIVRETPETLRFLIDENNKAIGYYYFIPMFEDMFSKAKNGQLFDSEITADKVPLFLQGIYNIYFPAICIREKYRKTLALKKMLISALDLFEELALSGIFINEICALAYSNSGASLCQSVGLKYTQNHIAEGKIYHGNIEDLLKHPLCTKYAKLKDLYNVNLNTKRSDLLVKDSD